MPIYSMEVRAGVAQWYSATLPRSKSRVRPPSPAPAAFRCQPSDLFCPTLTANSAARMGHPDFHSMFQARYPSGKGEVCKTFMRRFDPDPRLQSYQQLRGNPRSAQIVDCGSFVGTICIQPPFSPHCVDSPTKQRVYCAVFRFWCQISHQMAKALFLMHWQLKRWSAP